VGDPDLPALTTRATATDRELRMARSIDKKRPASSKRAKQTTKAAGTSARKKSA